MLHDGEARERVTRVDGLLERVEALPDPSARDAGMELVRALLDLYGEGLARVVDHVAEHDDGTLAAALASDELVSHLLLLHGLHPVPLEERVCGALDEVRPYLESHGGGVTLLGIEDGAVRLRMQGSCSGCPSSAVTLKLAIEEAIGKAAPDVERIEAEDAAPEAGLLQIELAPGWTTAGGMPELRGGGSIVKAVAGERVLFASLDGTVYAYRPECPACRSALEDGALAGADIVCAACGVRYDARLAGRCLDDPELHLDPVPLLEDGGGMVKVALA